MLPNLIFQRRNIKKFKVCKSPPQAKCFENWRQKFFGGNKNSHPKIGVVYKKKKMYFIHDEKKLKK